MNDGELLRNRVTDLASKYGRYGYKRVTALMNQDGGKVNHKRVFEFGKKKDLRFQPNDRRKPDYSLAMETVFAINQNTKDYV